MLRQMGLDGILFFISLSYHDVIDVLFFSTFLICVYVRPYESVCTQVNKHMLIALALPLPLCVIA